ncbi:hypothetical protein ElyMa_004740200 [Elysia marginata]|uniref:Uncharacterized protein n=1 Tax=Elysia marginata TaxID=1093978 RepID=A0AAV4IGQ6_9GAST|nr:hypothetical protein ElyMa_004740200 [Elysia marginata]
MEVLPDPYIFYPLPPWRAQGKGDTMLLFKPVGLMDTHQYPHLRRIPDQCPYPHCLNPLGRSPRGRLRRRRLLGRGGLPARDVPPALRLVRLKFPGILHMESILSKSTSGLVLYLSYGFCNSWGFLDSFSFGISLLIYPCISYIFLHPGRPTRHRARTKGRRYSAPWLLRQGYPGEEDPSPLVTSRLNSMGHTALPSTIEKARPKWCVDGRPAKFTSTTRIPTLLLTGRISRPTRCPIVGREEDLEG